MSGRRCVSYVRVSTVRQHASGLGLEAQQEAVRHFLKDNDTLVAEFVEIESGRRADRPELLRAIETARQVGALLVIARLDRLARSVAFVSALLDGGVEFVAADNPTASRLTIHILSAVAEEEARLVSLRTREALAAARARGVKLGNPNGAAAMAGRGNVEAVRAVRRRADRHAERILPRILEFQKAGIRSLAGIAKALNADAVVTARGGLWHATTVRNVLARSRSDARGRKNETRCSHHGSQPFEQQVPKTEPNIGGLRAQAQNAGNMRP